MADEHSSSLFTELSTAEMELVDDVCLRYEATWREGKEPSVDEFLKDIPEPTRSVLRGELASLEWEYTHGKIWYWMQKEKGAVRGGPFSWTELKEFASSGRLVADDLVCRKGMPNWVAAGPLLAAPPRDDSPVSSPTAADVPESADPFARSRAFSSQPTLLGEGVDSQLPNQSWPKIPGYVIEGVLGRGAMGKVFKARQPQLGARLVALKVIVTGQAAGSEELARFRLEASSLAALNHPNIVQVYEVGEWFTGDGSATLPFFSMEFVGFGTLAQRLAKSPQPPRDAAHLLADLAHAMHAAHLQNIVHRDLKPSNILLGSTDPSPSRPAAEIPLPSLIPKISDFGLAKHLNTSADLTQTGRLLGTPTYMAPEQAAGRVSDIGPATDVYALGTILYEMLTGRPPFTSADESKEAIPLLLDQIRTQDPIAPGRLVRLPRDLETICLKCLHKEPARRYPSAQGLAEDLDSFLANRPIKARPVGVVERTWRWCRRNPGVATLTVLLIFLGVTSFAAMGYLWLEAEHALGVAKKDRDQATARTEQLQRITRFDPGPVRTIVPGESFRAEGKMTQNGFLFLLNADKTYALELSSAEGSPYPLIWSPNGKLLPETPFVRKKQDFGGLARLNFRPPEDGTYRIMIAFRDTGPADYILTLREKVPGEFKK